MIGLPPEHPDIRRRLQQRLLDLTPRAFELFAGEMVSYLGLDNVMVTRYVGDGGIDAHGEIVSGAGAIRVPTGIQVKRHRQNVRRPDIDRFIGALSGEFSTGIFITTAHYAPQALKKAAGSIPRISTIDGDQVIALMLAHNLGVLNKDDPDSGIDELFFVDFEERIPIISRSLREKRGGYSVSGEQPASSEPQAAIQLQPADDLVSLRSLSYLLRVDTTTIRSWVERGKLQPDQQLSAAGREVYLFRRDRLVEIRTQFALGQQPATGNQWRQEFLDFAKSRSLVKSYKPVLMKSLLQHVNRNGEVSMQAVVREFREFYVQRKNQGLPVEYGVKLLEEPAQASERELKQLIIKHPLERFLIKGFLLYDAEQELIRFAPQLWAELRFYELLDVLQSANEQLDYYYGRTLEQP